MADPTTPAPAPADDATTDDTDTTAAKDGTDDGDQSGQVLLTVLKNDDGSYTVMEGDEPDAGADDDDSSKGDTFTKPGEVLNAVMDILKKDLGEGTDEENFAAGFSGEGPKPAA